MSSWQQISLPPLLRTNKIIMGLWIGAFLLDTLVRLAMDFSLTSLFALTPGRVISGEIYQIVTYPFFHNQMWDLLLHLLVLVFMGTALEHRWGERKYAFFLGGVTLFVAILYMLASVVIPSLQFLPLYGGGAWLFAMAVAYALIEPNAIFSLMMIFPVKAKWAVSLLLGLEIYSGLFSPLRQAALANLAGAAWAWLWIKGPNLNATQKNIKPKRQGAGKLRLVDPLGKNKEQESEDAKRNGDPKYWQ